MVKDAYFMLELADCDEKFVKLSQDIVGFFPLWRLGEFQS
jgi:hypothetical protein